MQHKHTTTLMMGLGIGLLLAVGMSLSGYFVSQTLYKSKVAVNVAEVKGLAEREVKADIAYWSLSFNVTRDISVPLETLYQEANTKQQTIIDFLLANGFTQEEIQIESINYHTTEYRDDNQKIVEQRHSLYGSMTINTEHVDHVASVRAKVNALISEGIDLTSYTPRYLFTQLNDIKPEMLREATQNAKTAANEFAQVADVKVGSIKDAYQGNFSITDLGESYSDDQKLMKKVRVVTTISFYLTH